MGAHLVPRSAEPHDAVPHARRHYLALKRSDPAKDANRAWNTLITSIPMRALRSWRFFIGVIATVGVAAENTVHNGLIRLTWPVTASKSDPRRVRHVWLRPRNGRTRRYPPPRRHSAENHYAAAAHRQRALADDRNRIWHAELDRPR